MTKRKMGIPSETKMRGKSKIIKKYGNQIEPKRNKEEKQKEPKWIFNRK